jgi:hypothetical protein
MFLGHPAYLTPKGRGNNSRLEKRLTAEDMYAWGSRKTRVIWERLAVCRRETLSDSRDLCYTQAYE